MTQMIGDTTPKIPLPTKWGEFTLQFFANNDMQGSNDGHLALTIGNINDDIPVLVRVHSECLTGDLFCSEAVLRFVEDEIATPAK